MVLSFDWTCHGNIRSDRGYLSYNFCFSKNHLSVNCFCCCAITGVVAMNVAAAKLMHVKIFFI